MYFSGIFPPSKVAYSSQKSVLSIPRFGAKAPESLVQSHGEDAQRITDYIEKLASDNLKHSRDIAIQANRDLGVFPTISKYHVQVIRGEQPDSVTFDTFDPASAPSNPEKRKFSAISPKEDIPRSASLSPLSSAESLSDSCNPFLLSGENKPAPKPMKAGRKGKYTSVEDDYLSDGGRPENSSRNKVEYHRAIKSRTVRRLAFVRQNLMTQAEKNSIRDEVAATPEYQQANTIRRGMLINNANKRRANELIREYFKK